MDRHVKGGTCVDTCMEGEIFADTNIEREKERERERERQADRQRGPRAPCTPRRAMTPPAWRENLD